MAKPQQAPTAPIRLVFGLGNPGSEYERTRHNVGRMVVHRLGERHDGEFRRKWRLSAEVCDVEIGSRRVTLARSRTYMNESGRPAGAFRRTRGIRGSQMLVVLDDADLPLGRVRIREGGGSGGHRGLASILGTVGGDPVPRVRIGIGRGGGGGGERGLVGHVLSTFAPDEWDAVRDSVERAADAVETAVRDGLVAAMNQYN